MKDRLIASSFHNLMVLPGPNSLEENTIYFGRLLPQIDSVSKSIFQGAQID